MNPLFLHPPTNHCRRLNQWDNKKHLKSPTITPYSTHLNRPSTPTNSTHRYFADLDCDLRQKAMLPLQFTFVPNYNRPPIQRQEHIFVIDRSGHTQGAPFEQAKRKPPTLIQVFSTDPRNHSHTNSSSPSEASNPKTPKPNRFSPTLIHIPTDSQHEKSRVALPSPIDLVPVPPEARQLRRAAMIGDVSVHKLVVPRASLLDFFSHFGDIRLEQPIYLYVRPPLPDLPKGMTSSLDFWSFHETSQFPLSFDMTLSFGLPVEKIWIDSRWYMEVAPPVKTQELIPVIYSTRPLYGIPQHEDQCLDFDFQSHPRLRTCAVATQTKRQGYSTTWNTECSARKGKVPTLKDVEKNVKVRLGMLDLQTLLNSRITLMMCMDVLPKRRYASFELFYAEDSLSEYKPVHFKPGNSEKDKWHFTPHDFDEVPDRRQMECRQNRLRILY
ncbi:hypothetical protein PQX77_011596, partial [Marasmius sp. AFHP31]